MPIAQLSDVALRYEIVGSGEPVLLVAGLGGSAGYWAPNVEGFAARHQVVLHDHRGTGGSTRSEMDYSVELLADDLLRLMDHLKIDKAHLVGHSTGGAMGIVLGAKAPERIASLVLYATWVELDAQMEQCLSLRRRILRAMGEAEYHRATPLFLYPPTYVRDHRADLEREIAAAIAATPSRSIMDARAKGVMAFDGLRYLGDIRCPTLVLVAQDDILTPPYSSKLIAARIVGSELVEVPRGGHAYSRVEPDAFNSLTLDFLAAHPIGTYAHV